MDREVKCCLDYIMVGTWNQQKESMFEVREVLDVWDESEIKQFECRLPNRIYPSDHLLIAVKVALNADERKEEDSQSQQEDWNEEQDDWNEEQQAALQEALKVVRTLPIEERWDKVEEMVPGKTKKQCLECFKWICAQSDVKKK